VGFLALYTLFEFPVDIAFNLPMFPLVWLNLVVDIVFLADLILTFRVAYFRDDGSLETRPDHIRSNYLKSYFIVDLIASIPISVLNLALY
jgi:hypothetical protein